MWPVAYVLRNGWPANVIPVASCHDYCHYRQTSSPPPHQIELKIVIVGLSHTFVGCISASIFHLLSFHSLLFLWTLRIPSSPPPHQIELKIIVAYFRWWQSISFFSLLLFSTPDTMFSKVRSSILAAAVLSLLVTCKGFSGVRVGAPTRTSRLNQSTLVHNRRLVETSHPRVQTMDESPGRPTRISVAVDNLFKIDKSKIAKLGANFVLSYSVVSTINGAVSLSVAWYIASIRVSFIWWAEKNTSLILRSELLIFCFLLFFRLGFHHWFPDNGNHC